MERERENDGFPWQMNAVMVILNEEKVSRLLGTPFSVQIGLRLLPISFAARLLARGIEPRMAGRIYTFPTPDAFFHSSCRIVGSA